MSQTLTLEAIEQARDILALPDMDDPAWILEQVMPLLGIRRGHSPKEIPPIEIWRASQSLDFMALAKQLAEETFQADPEILSVTWDFLDCDGVPFVWLGFEPKEDEGDENRVTAQEYTGGGPVPVRELEQMSYDLLREFGREQDTIEFTRGEAPAVEPVAEEPPAGLGPGEREFEVLVRTNCEYSLLVSVFAKNQGEADEKALAEAEKVPYAEWSQAWADGEVDHDSDEMEG